MVKVGIWWLSNNQMTVKVKTDPHRIIIDAAPIVRKFKGQHLERLTNWMQRQGTTDMTLLAMREE